MNFTTKWEKLFMVFVGQGISINLCQYMFQCESLLVDMFGTVGHPSGPELDETHIAPNKPRILLWMVAKSRSRTTEVRSPGMIGFPNANTATNNGFNHGFSRWRGVHFVDPLHLGWSGNGGGDGVWAWSLDGAQRPVDETFVGVW